MRTQTLNSNRFYRNLPILISWSASLLFTASAFGNSSPIHSNKIQSNQVQSDTIGTKYTRDQIEELVTSKILDLVNIITNATAGNLAAAAFNAGAFSATLSLQENNFDQGNVPYSVLMALRPNHLYDEDNYTDNKEYTVVILNASGVEIFNGTWSKQVKAEIIKPNLTYYYKIMRDKKIIDSGKMISKD